LSGDDFVVDDITYEDTRFALHAAAELLIAGPQYRRFGSIRMRIVLGGFSGIKWPVSVTGVDLCGPTGDPSARDLSRPGARGRVRGGRPAGWALQ